MNEGALLQASFLGSKQRPPIKKETTPKCKGLKTKTSNEKSHPKMQRAHNKELKTKTSDEKRGNPGP
jgi:hypothetical protein